MDRITELTGADLTYLLNVLATAEREGQRVRIHQTEDGKIKVARGGGMWTLGFGKDAKS